MTGKISPGPIEDYESRLEGPGAISKYHPGTKYAPEDPSMKGKIRQVIEKHFASESLLCQGCNSEIQLSQPDTTGGNVGALMRASGCEPIIHNDTSVGWLCPSCAGLAVPLIQALLDLLGDARDTKRPRAQFTYWNCLPDILKRRRLAAEAKAKVKLP
jgi:hypothetical protein